MEKEFLKREFGFLEEQLERITYLVESNQFSSLEKTKEHSLEILDLLVSTDASIKELGRVVREEALKNKSVNSEEFLAKIVRFLIQEATKEGLSVSVVQSARGKVSIESVENSMHAIVACIREWIGKAKNVSKSDRLGAGLYETFTVNLKVEATVHELFFKFVDDCSALCTSENAEYEVRQQVETIRSTVAKSNGWCQSRIEGECGHCREIKIPVASARVAAWRIRFGAQEVLCPVSCIKEFDLLETAPELKQGCLATLDRKNGLRMVGKIEAGSPRLKVGIADHEIYIVFEGKPTEVLCRHVPVKSFFLEDFWVRELGIFPSEKNMEVLPLLSGDFLNDYCSTRENEDESR